MVKLGTFTHPQTTESSKSAECGTSMHLFDDFSFQLRICDGQDMSRVINGTKEAGVHPHHVFG